MPLKFEQRRDRHAIGEFSAAVTFFQPVSANTMAKAVTELAAYARENNLPAPVNTQVFTFAVGQATPPSAQQVAGWQRFSSAGEPEVTVTCDEVSIHFATRTYSSWAEIRPILSAYFARISQHYVSEVPAITGFQIRYLNEFRNVNAEFDPGTELFRAPNDCIIPNVARFRDAWHSHCGWFETVSQNRRRLVNVNVDCKVGTIPQVSHPVTTLGVSLLVSERYDVPNESPLVIPVGELEAHITEHLDDAHSREKAVLAELFADDYLKLMGALE